MTLGRKTYHVHVSKSTFYNYGHIKVDACCNEITSIDMDTLNLNQMTLASSVICWLKLHNQFIIDADPANNSTKTQICFLPTFIFSLSERRRKMSSTLSYNVRRVWARRCQQLLSIASAPVRNIVSLMSD